MHQQPTFSNVAWVLRISSVHFYCRAIFRLSWALLDVATLKGTKGGNLGIGSGTTHNEVQFHSVDSIIVGEGGGESSNRSSRSAQSVKGGRRGHITAVPLSHPRSPDRHRSTQTRFLSSPL